MGALDRFRTAAREAVEQGRAAAARAAGGDVTRVAGGDVLARAGETAAGAALGHGVRTAGRVMGGLPLLSAPMDLFGSRHGVDALVAAVQSDPDGILPHLWLGEALQSLRTDARRFEQVRTVVAALDPASFVIRQAVRTAAQLGAAPAADPAAQVLARCRHLAARALAVDPRDAVALYALARVALATGRADLAVQPAKLAVAAFGLRAGSGTGAPAGVPDTGTPTARPGTGAPAARPGAGAPDDGDRGRALVVLAHAYLVLGRDASAANVARKAVDAGCSLGWTVLAELAVREPGGLRAHADLSARVTDTDRCAYHGAYRTPAEIGRAVWEAQGRRARDLGGSGQSAVHAAAHRIPAYNARARTERIELPGRR
ncbi:tetratricopeptide repeat protein [Pseudonocardia sp.]|uniref:tetratricopeptide repeat protein n=1 Tax=Pseudonocardia sp. TaxID=60912 RepID=UPI003D0CE902